MKKFWLGLILITMIVIGAVSVQGRSIEYKDEDGFTHFINIVDGELVVALPKTAFGELLVAELHPQIQQSFEYTVDNTDLNTNLEVNGGTVTQASGMAVLTTSTTTASTAFLESTHHIRYRGGLGGMARFTALFTSPVTGTEQYIGLADEIGSAAAAGTVTLTGGASGSVDGITIDSIEIMSGAESFDTDLTETAMNVVSNINANTSAPNYSATSLGAVITIISDVRGTGPNGFVVTSSTTTITTTDANLSGGTNGEAFKNGYVVGYDGGIFGFHRFQNGVKFTVDINDWDDPLDGFGTSGVEIDQTKLNVFFIKYQYLGGGAIKIFYEKPDGDLIKAHTVPYANLFTEPSTHNPNFHFVMWVNNGGTTSNMILKNSSYGYFSEGKTSFIEIHQPQNSSGLISKASVTTETAIFTIKVRESYVSKDNYIDILLENITAQIEADAANNLGSVRIVQNAILGGTPSYANVNTANSVVEIDTAGTTVTGGKTLVVIPLAGKNDKGIIDLTPFKNILKHGDTLTVAGLSANSATIQANILWRELF